MRRALVVLAVLAACGPKPIFRFSADDNDRGELSSALARRQLPEQAAPVNSARAPRVFVLAGHPPAIVAIDLASGSALWKAPADVASRIWVGGDFIVELEGKQLVARSQQGGAVRWKAELSGPFVGAAADGERAYAVWHDGAKWRLAAFDGASGSRLWKADSDGQLGAPTAQGGLIYVPFLSQWLSLLDGKTGDQLARVRALESQISIVRATSQIAYYGSRAGMFRLDAAAASGQRATSDFGQVKLPPQLDRASYGRDMYDAVQAGYSAFDRTRVLFTTEPSETGPLRFTGDGYAIHYFRYLLGLSSAGELRWAYSHPRVELVASEHTGRAIVALGEDGELVALDPATGAVRLSEKLAVPLPVLGATFDAEGWTPAGEGAPVRTV
ncbi:MAG TPA: PQQ-binding-like beta-propeller repeat protein, partial [Kofleriaceae bacterium]|nr:PQQ-binding-like beta-propeller repeat protein [Kofleriaceae bacterium]